MTEVSILDGWFSSAKQGRQDDLQELIKTIKDVNLIDPLGNTALHYSAAAGHSKCVEILVNNGHANVNVQNKVGDTPLHKAAWKGSLAVVKYLVEKNSDLKIKNSQGQTAKQLAKDAQIASLLEPVTQRLWEDDDDDELEQKKKKKGSDDEDEEDD